MADPFNLGPWLSILLSGSAFGLLSAIALEKADRISDFRAASKQYIFMLLSPKTCAAFDRLRLLNVQWVSTQGQKLHSKHQLLVLF
jgi:predicted outer membrane lipoprotein